MTKIYDRKGGKLLNKFTLAGNLGEDPDVFYNTAAKEPRWFRSGWCIFLDKQNDEISKISLNTAYSYHG